MLQTYIVTWKHYGVPCLIDFDREGQALAAAVALAEVGDGRTEIRVTAEEYEETDEDRERKARIWARIESKIKSEWALPAVVA